MEKSIQLPLRLGGSLSGLLGNISHGSHCQATAPYTMTSFFSTSSAFQMKAKGRKVKRVRFDPYHAAQAAQVKAANLARREVLQKERAEALGDPVRSNQTPFIQSLRNQDAGEHRNFFVDSKELSETLDNSTYLTEPLPETKDSISKDTPNYKGHEPEEQWQAKLKAWKEDDLTARIALDRITALGNASSADRTRVNVQRCIEEFGRHNTDSALPSRPQGPAQLATPQPEHPKLRAGPDTGSSEVQVAILTAKIDKLSDHVAKVGHKDKHNKRNLRVLVHRRQKLLTYLRRRERGGPRWSNLMDKLGLSDGAWKGEISL